MQCELLPSIVKYFSHTECRSSATQGNSTLLQTQTNVHNDSKVTLPVKTQNLSQQRKTERRGYQGMKDATDWPGGGWAGKVVARMARNRKTKSRD